MATIQDLLGEGRRRLARLPGTDPALEARVLLRRTLGVTELEILACPERPVAPAEAGRFSRAISRRAARVPFAAIIGEREFWSMPFQVVPGVLIPRPETELLVETVLEKIRDENATIAEIGTGSGAVAVALAKELRSARIIATDISRRALNAARANARRHGATNVEFLGGDLFAPLRRNALAGRIDVLVCNPPYVAESDWRRLEPEVRGFEPKRALVPGPTGLEFIVRLAAGASDFVKTGGILAFEIGRGQARPARACLKKPWRGIEARKDLRGILRVIVAERGTMC